ncbi:histone deacetylase complex subunit SAP30 isoform X1 [Equus quagga]|uniref:histone deacetylase complex subunit SAP30 isoform X1 n=1 Tax=Equus quagga TaxID=89248 RepID=UPI001EE158E5|nr:histone deacetylase complex subunit SAP30 isoform X1 [Equus quagga]
MNGFTPEEMSRGGDAAAAVAAVVAAAAAAAAAAASAAGNGAGAGAGAEVPGAGAVSAAGAPGAAGPGPGQLCCLREDGERCGRAAGNASFSKRIQKSISQKKVKIELDKSARHLYICDYHKNLIQSVRNRRKRKGSDDDGGDSPVQDIDTPEVDLYQLQVNTLRRYKRHFKLPTRPGLNKAQLVEVNKVQRMSGRTCPQEQQRLRRPLVEPWFILLQRPSVSLRRLLEPPKVKLLCVASILLESLRVVVWGEAELVSNFTGPSQERGHPPWQMGNQDSAMECLVERSTSKL